MRSAGARSMLRILPRRGRMACVVRSRPCLADPAAESPSTMKISETDASRLAQSESFPGRTEEARMDLRRTMSLAARAASAALCAAPAFSSTAPSRSGRHSKSLRRAWLAAESTAALTSGLPRRPLVCPSNSGSDTPTATSAVSPSRMYSPGMLGPPSLILPSFLAAALTVRVSPLRSPSTCDPPSRVRMLLQKERTDSL
mmetsp:Transcript_42129/g.82629  ORF Transcript_42129/g.82629 Transcript_42129/m.82629 type:complete len:200 (+) Transcript_42129:548-1147(+)